MSHRVDSPASTPTTTILFEEPTSDAVFKVELEKLSSFKGAMTVTVPGRRAELLVTIAMILAIVFSPSILLWTTHTALPFEKSFTILGLQFITLLLLGALRGRDRKGSKK